MSESRKGDTTFVHTQEAHVEVGASWLKDAYRMKPSEVFGLFWFIGFGLGIGVASAYGLALLGGAFLKSLRMV